MSLIAIDTNVLVRVLTRDDRRQADQAAALLRTGPLWLSKTVLLETEWVLRYTYKFRSVDINRALYALASLQHLTVEDGESVKRALAWHAAGMDFADALHLASAEQARKLVTFDRGLAKLAASVGATPPVESIKSSK